MVKRRPPTHARHTSKVQLEKDASSWCLEKATLFYCGTHCAFHVAIFPTDSFLK